MDRCPNCGWRESTIEEQAESIRQFGKDLVEEGAEACRKFLISTGAYNEDGTLTENYKENRGRFMKKRMTLQDKAELAIKKAVRQVVAQHKKDGRPLAVWENGKVKKVVAK